MSDVINGIPRELLERIACEITPKTHQEMFDSAKDFAAAIKELRALLTAQPQASAAQSAPAGEREAAVEAAYSSVVEGGWTSVKEMGVSMFQAGAAWQRAQSAGVLELQRKADLFDQYAGEAERLGFSGIGDALDALATAPAQQAAQGNAEILEQCANWCANQAASDWYGKTAADMVRKFASSTGQPAAQDQGEVQRMRERHALESIANCREGYLSGAACARIARAALAASTGQEVKR